MTKLKEDFGNPETTPFVRFISGTALYPAPTLYEASKIFFDKYRGDDLTPIMQELVKEGPVAGQYGVLLDATWFAIINTFLLYNTGAGEGVTDWQKHCVEALSLMCERPHGEAWKRLKTFLLEKIDIVSGWTSSWQRAIGDREKIFRADDGNFYMHDHEGTLLRVIGAKPLDETRLDFISDQIIWRHGFLRQFLELFALFAITDDFSIHSESYPPAMKALLSESEYQRIHHMWHFMYFDRTRTVKWRPYSNLCDPDWLASDLLSRVVDTLTIDHFRKRGIELTPSDLWVKDPRQFQYDCVVDSGLRLGGDDEAYLEFEGVPFRWSNGSAERNTVVSMLVGKLGDNAVEVGRLNRMLSALSWYHKVHIARLWATGGGRRGFPRAYSPRMSGAIQVQVNWALQFLQRKLTPDQWFALGLFREGLNSRSKFYSYVCYYKVVEFALKKPEQRHDWINNTASTLSREKERINEILKGNPDLEEYLREACRNAILHVWHKPTLDPDDPVDTTKIATDIYVIQDFARLAIETVLGVTG